MIIDMLLSQRRHCLDRDLIECRPVVRTLIIRVSYRLTNHLKMLHLHRVYLGSAIHISLVENGRVLIYLNMVWLQQISIVLAVVRTLIVIVMRMDLLSQRGHHLDWDLIG